jgi:hypothetical protein
MVKSEMLTREEFASLLTVSLRLILGDRGFIKALTGGFARQTLAVSMNC